MSRGRNVTEAKHPEDETSLGQKTGGETSGSRDGHPGPVWVEEC